MPLSEARKGGIGLSLKPKVFRIEFQKRKQASNVVNLKSSTVLRFPSYIYVCSSRIGVGGKLQYEFLR